MNEQPTPEIITQTKHHSHTVLYASLGILIVTVLLLLVVIEMSHKTKNSASITYRPPQPTTLQQAKSVAQTPQQQLQQSVTPVPIATKQDLTTQQNVLDSANMTAITNGLNQNTADASQFSQ